LGDYFAGRPTRTLVTALPVEKPDSGLTPSVRRSGVALLRYPAQVRLARSGRDRRHPGSQARR
jgi:hypothetical protein